MQPGGDMRRAAGFARYFINALFSVLLIFLFTASPGAEMYKYVNRDGAICYTNVPTYGQSTPVTLPPLNQANFNKYFPTYHYQYRPSGTLPPMANMQQYEAHINLTSKYYGLDSNLVKAVIRAESGCNPQAVSPKGACGLMQLMPGTSRDMGVTNPFDPWQNIEGGARYLRLMMDRFSNNLHLALAAYNAGPEAVVKHGGIPPYDETQIYVKRVIDIYNRSK